MKTDVVRAGYWFWTNHAFPVGSIDSKHFTHLFCAFAEVDPETYTVSFPTQAIHAFSTFTETVQRKNPDVKTLLSIGEAGPSDNPILYSITSNKANRKLFISSSVDFARSNNFHGLDLCWLPTSFPPQNGFFFLLKEWRDAITAEAEKSGNEPLLLTAQFEYDVEFSPCPPRSIPRFLDWMNLVAYDFHSPRNSRSTRAHAACRSKPGDPSGEYSINAWMEKGVNQKKIVLGLPLFGNAWSLANAKNNGMFAPAKGAPSSYPTGVISYEQITKFLAKIDTTQKFDPDTETNYCYNSTTWISYDDRKSIAKKIEHARDLELLGYFVWHMGNDHNWILSKTAADEWGEKRLGAEAYDIVVSSDVEAFVSR